MSDADTPTGNAGRPEAGASRAVARNATHLVLGQVVTTTLAVLLAAALGRALGVVDFGLYYFVTSTSTFVYVLIDWGQSAYVTREIAQKPDRMGSLLASMLALRTAGALAAAAVTALALGLLDYDARTGALSALFIVTSLPFFLAQTYGAAFRGQERMDLDAVVSVANKVLVLALTLGAFAMHGGLAGAIVAQGFAGAGAVLVAHGALRRLGVPLRRPSVPVARELFVGGTPIVAMYLAASASSYADVILLTKLAPVEAMGWFGAGRNIYGTIGNMAGILGAAAFPRLSRAAHDPAAFRHELTVAMRPLLGIAALAGVGSYLFADVAVGLVFGHAKFAPAATIIRANVPGQFLLFIDVALASAIIAMGRPKVLAVAKAVSVLVTIGLNIWLIPYFQATVGNGGIGVVVSFVGSEVVMFVAALWILPRSALAPSLLLDAGRAIGASFLTLAIFRLAPPVTPFLAIPLSVVVFVGLAALLGLVRREELRGLVNFLTRRGS